MPVVTIPNVGRVTFPDSMSQDDITTAIERDILKREQSDQIVRRPETGGAAGVVGPVMDAATLGQGAPSPFTIGQPPSGLEDAQAAVETQRARAQAASVGQPTIEIGAQPATVPRFGKPGTFVGEASGMVAGLGEWALNNPEEFLASIYPPTQAAVALRYAPSIVAQAGKDAVSAAKGDTGALGRLAALSAMVLGPKGVEAARAKYLAEGPPGMPLPNVDAMARASFRDQPALALHETLLPRSAEAVKQIERTPDAIPQRETTTLPLEEPPGDSSQMGAQVREQTQTETPETTLTPAIQVQGKTFTGEDHLAAYENAKASGQPDTSGAQEGFANDKGGFLTRKEAAQQTGLPTEIEPGKLHSSDLPQPGLDEAILDAISEGGMVKGIKRGGDKSGHYVVAPPEGPGDSWFAVGPFKDIESASDFLDAEVGAPGAKVIQVDQTGKPVNKPPSTISKTAPELQAPSEPAVSEASKPGERPPGSAPAISQATTEGEKSQGDTGPGMIGMGGAASGELPETGAGAEKYGVAARVREERAKAGQVADVPPGKGISAPDSVEHGRELLASGQNPESALSAFEQTRRLSSDDMALVRAEGERLAQEARKTEAQFGTESPEYKAAWQKLSLWDARSKAMQTEWHKTGQAQQGETDLDTGTFTGLQRAYREETGKDFTPEQKTVAEQKAGTVKAAETAEANAKQSLFDHIKQTGEKTDAQRTKISDYVIAIAEKWVKQWEKEAAAARSRLAGKFLSPSPEDLLDLARIVRFRIAELGLDTAKMTAAMVAELGEGVRPYVQSAMDRAQKMIEGVVETVPAGKAREQVKSRLTGSVPNAEKRALDAASEVVRNNAARIAEAERKQSVADAERDKQVQEINQNLEAKLKATTDRTVRDAAIRLAKAETKAAVERAAKEKAAAEIERKTAQKALDAASEAGRRAAEQAAKADKKTAVKRAKLAKEISELERKAADKTISGIRKAQIGLAIRRAKAAAAELEARADLPTYTWKLARDYIEKGMEDWDDIRNKIATDMGLPVEKVTQALAKDKRAKFLADEAWRKQQVARRVKQQAKQWLVDTTVPGYIRALRNIPRIMFSLKVGFHGTVALGTHAPMVAFQPRFWAAYVRDFVKMYRMVGAPTPKGQARGMAYYEMQVQDLQRRPNYITARRAGLVNDPFQYEDYNSPDTTKYIGKLATMGNRGYSVLKILRQDMFDQMWDQLPKTAKIPEMAQAIADGVNHATGVVKGKAPTGTNLAFFAPRLEASRVMWLAGDPMRAANTFLKWKDADLGERAFALNQLKEKGWVMGTMLGLLALNQGFLSAIGSDQQINVTDPMESDFLRFKVGGMSFSYGGAMVNMAKLPGKLALAIAFRGKMGKAVLEDERVSKVLFDYARSQASPFASVAVDLATGRDYAGRPLPRKLFGTLEGDTDIPKRLRLHGITEPYSWTEWASEEFTPIPIEEGLKEVWNAMGMNEGQQEQAMKALLTISVMSATGGRLTEDYKVQR